MSKVKINEANIRHCRCPHCPVQKNSPCSNAKLAKPVAPENFRSENTAMLYCALGKTTCKDISPRKDCICPSCLVWDENNLSSYHYCINGNADEIG